MEAKTNLHDNRTTSETFPLSPTGTEVIASIIKTPEQYGSIYAPFQHNTQEAIVKSVGPDRSDLSPGDRVIYRPYTPRGFDWEGNHYIILDTEDLLAVIE